MRKTAQLLSSSVAAYGYVSGISVYHPDGPDVVDENSPLRYEDDVLGHDPLRERSLLKLAREAALRENYGGSLLIARLGNVIGLRDPTDRSSWWPERFRRALDDGKPVLAPGDPGRQTQFTVARDLAAWLVRSVSPRREGGSLTGTFNAVGPGREEGLEHVLAACLEAARDGAGETEIKWAEEDFLRERLAGIEVEARPSWFPEYQIPFTRVDSSAALAAGLTFRPACETARDTLRWPKAHSYERKAGFIPDEKARLISDWQGSVVTAVHSRERTGCA